jgi:ankyrin repeat protein
VWGGIDWCTGEHVSNVNIANEQGQTPLHYTTRHGHTAVVSLLLSSQADTQLQSKHSSATQVCLLFFFLSQSALMMMMMMMMMMKPPGGKRGGPCGCSGAH